MKLSDILKLDNNVTSLNIIQTFLNQPLSYDDYIKAITYYLKIANDNNLDELVLEEGNKTLNKFINQKPLEEHEKIYSYLIDAAINLEKFNLVQDYIEERRKLLNIMDQYQTIIDEIKLNKALNKDIYGLLKKLVIETIPYDIKTKSYEALLEIYENKKDYTNALVIISELIEHTNNDKYLNNKLKIFYLEERTFEALELAENIIEKDENNIFAVIVLIAANTKLNKLRRASSLEANYEQLIDNASDELKELAYTEIINLYTVMNNKISLDFYNKKLSKLKRNKNNKEVIKATEKIESGDVKPEIIKVEVYKDSPKDKSILKYLQYYEWLNEWLIKSHLINEKLALREYLRQLLIEVSKKIDFIEAVIYIENAKDSNIFNYKKERLYDKQIIKPYVTETIINEALELGEPIFTNPKTFKFNKDIITQKPYDDKVNFIYAFPVDEGIAIAFYLEEELLDPSKYYELYEGIATIIYTKLLDIRINERLLKENKFYQDIVLSSSIPVRIMTETKSLYNESATEFFNISYNEHLEIFLRDVSVHDIPLYNTTVKRLFNYPNERKIIKYKYQEKIIIEHLYAIVKNGEVNIISFFIDITNHVLKEETLTKEIIIDHETNLKNRYLLKKELKTHLEEKVTFILIELDQTLKQVYGNNKINQFFIEFAKATKTHFNDMEVYRFDFNQLLVVLNYNDIRAVDKTLKEYFSVILHLKSQVLPYEKYKLSAGVLRYPVVTTEKNHDKIFNYLDISLNKAKNDRESHYNHFIFKDYEDDIYEQQIIDYLNTAIENKQLELYFKQIIDLDNNKIWQYESELILPNINIDSKYLNLIAKKRKKLVDLEHYHIEAVCIFLSKLEEETNRLIKLTIPISSETFLKNDFQGYLIGTLKQYRIPADFIRIVTDVDLRDRNNSLKIQEIIKFGISLDTTNLETALSHEFHALHLELKHKNHKWLAYYSNINEFLKNNHIAFVLRNVNTKEEREIAESVGITYIEGLLYKKIDSKKLLEKIKESV
ncbi:MAG TPA: GGDEF domain-containing protein [Acholeplasmataceae bacterium]|nr:GGDEF domain-containing protein [Acholeplasmataceae bacterium]